MRLDFLSQNGVALPLVGNELFELTHVDGLTTAEAALAASSNGDDGDTINAVTANARTIVIDLRIKNGVSVEQAKRTILQAVKIKQTARLEWEQEGRKLTIEGTVEGIDMPRFTNAVVMQITMHCSQPFWQDAAFVVQQINEAIALHYFADGYNEPLFFPEGGIVLGEYDTTRTKTFYNNGDVAVGLEITVIALSTVTNPVLYDNNGNFLGVGYGDGTKKVVMQAGDVLTITTGRGNKDIIYKGQSILPKLKPQSTWLQLEAGDNTFTIDSDDASLSNMTFSLEYKQRYV